MKTDVEEQVVYSTTHILTVQISDYSRENNLFERQENGTILELSLAIHFRKHLLLTRSPGS